MPFSVFQSDPPIARAGRLGLISAVVLGMVVSIRADVVHLTGGMVIEVQSIEDCGKVHRVKSWQGTYDIEKERVQRIEAGTGDRAAYEAERMRHKDTADGQLALARWCAGRGLASERQVHLKRVIEIDPDQAEAREALGYERREGKWIKSRASKAPTDDVQEARRLVRQQEDFIRKRIAEQTVRVKDILHGRLNAARNDKARSQFADGRRQLLLIRDPFAIGPISEVLSRGDVATRLLMVESLARFTEDEATMNMIVVALLDPAEEVRKSATDELVRRKDDRIVAVFAQALGSDKEWTLRRAATALGRLKARAAVPNLINCLSTQTLGTVRTSQAVYLDYIMYLYGRPAGYSSGANVVFYRPRAIGVLGPGALVGTLDRYQTDVVSVYRTEVQEALIAITGKNFGFDRQAWADWWAGQR